MRRAWLNTSAFCKAKMLERCLERLYRNGRPDVIEHTIIDNHYPVDKENNRRRIREIAAKFGCLYIDSGKDLGLHRGVNNAMKQLDLRDDDIWIGVDPDDAPDLRFVETFREVMTADRSLAAVCCAIDYIYETKKRGVPYKEEVVLGHPLWIHPSVEMFTVSAFDVGFLKRVGGMRQPCAYYGGLEVSMHELWVKEGKRIGYLPELHSDQNPYSMSDASLVDQSYRDYKVAHSTDQFKGSFEEWLGC